MGNIFRFSVVAKVLRTHLVAILLDMLRSRPPMALVIDDTKRGTIKHFSILKSIFYSELTS